MLCRHATETMSAAPPTITIPPAPPNMAPPDPLAHPTKNPNKATAGGGARRTGHRSGTAMGHVGDPRATGDDDEEDALKPTAYVVAGRRHQHALPERGRDHVRGAADHQHRHGTAEHGSAGAVREADEDAEERHRQAPDQARDHPGPSLA